MLSLLVLGYRGISPASLSRLLVSFTDKSIPSKNCIQKSQNRRPYIYIYIYIGDTIYFDDNACGKPYHVAIITIISNNKIYYTAHSTSNKDLEKHLTLKSKSKKIVYAIAIKDRL